MGRVKANCPIVHAVADHLEGADHAIWRERRAAVSRPGAHTAATRLPKRVPGCATAATAWRARRLLVRRVPILAGQKLALVHVSGQKLAL